MFHLLIAATVFTIACKPEDPNKRMDEDLDLLDHANYEYTMRTDSFQIADTDPFQKAVAICECKGEVKPPTFICNEPNPRADFQTYCASTNLYALYQESLKLSRTLDATPEHKAPTSGRCATDTASFTTAGGGCRYNPTGLIFSGIFESAGSLSHNEASEACKNLDLGGFRDWTLPSASEVDAVVMPSKELHSALSFGLGDDPSTANSYIYWMRDVSPRDPNKFLKDGLPSYAKAQPSRPVMYDDGNKAFFYYCVRSEKASQAPQQQVQVTDINVSPLSINFNSTYAATNKIVITVIAQTSAGPRVVTGESTFTPSENKLFSAVPNQPGLFTVLNSPHSLGRHTIQVSFGGITKAVKIQLFQEYDVDIPKDNRNIINPEDTSKTGTYYSDRANFVAGSCAAASQFLGRPLRVPSADEVQAGALRAERDIGSIPLHAGDKNISRFAFTTAGPNLLVNIDGGANFKVPSKLRACAYTPKKQKVSKECQDMSRKPDGFIRATPGSNKCLKNPNVRTFFGTGANRCNTAPGRKTFLIMCLD